MIQEKTETKTHVIILPSLSVILSAADIFHLIGCSLNRLINPLSKGSLKK